MAVIMSTDNTKFLKHVLSKHPQELGKALTLLSTGMVLEVSIYTLKATYEGKATQHGTLTSTSNLMKYSGDPKSAVFDAATADIAAWFDELWADQMGSDAPKVAPSIKEALAKAKAEGIKPTIKPAPNVFEGEIEQAAKATIFPEGPPIKATMVSETQIPQPVKKQPKPGVIPLKEAEVVGQQVTGTSPGSVYKTIAVSPGVKVAVRVNGSQLSLRVETTKNCTGADLTKVQASGLQMHSGYGSLHLDTGNPQIMRRTIGAFLFGMDVKFTDQLSAGENL